jgi:hypothetical protein
MYKERGDNRGWLTTAVYFRKLDQVAATFWVQNRREGRWLHRCVTLQVLLNFFLLLGF